MKNILISCGLIVMFLISGTYLPAQQHLANGEAVIRGNRLISVKSPIGKQLYHPERNFLKRDIKIDAAMTEPEWNQAQVVAPFLNVAGGTDKTIVRVLYDQSNIYLFWNIDQPDGVTTRMKEKDSIITTDDYVQIDLKPWLPDSILHGRDYSYSIAVNPAGIIWDAYLDPYLGGFYFSSWNSAAKVSTKKQATGWQVEMTIPYENLDVVSEPGWKWNIEFHHGTFTNGATNISSAQTGVTVQQDITVRQPGFVTYYWARPEFVPVLKQPVDESNKKQTSAGQLHAAPKINNKEDGGIWKGATMLAISSTDKTGKPLTANSGGASIGIFKNTICFNLHADGAKIRNEKDNPITAGTGMAAQMAGVNGVFVDQSLFKKESFWVIMQPRNIYADKIHQDYYMIIIDNSGEITGTHYDQFGVPVKTWHPKAGIDLYNTASGWGVEVNVSLESFDIPVDNNTTWGLNIFRNRLINSNDYELQAWKSTANDFLNPAKFGELTGVDLNNPAVFRSGIQRKIAETNSLLLSHDKEKMIQDFQRELKAFPLGSLEQLRSAEGSLQQMDHVLGRMDGVKHYQSAPHPATSGLPLMDVQFIGKYGWAVGAMGTILRSEDGGQHWQPVLLNTDADLYRVKFVNENEGWAAGGRIRMGETNESMRHDERGGVGYIYHTKDGGKTWDCQFAERGRHLFALDFVNENVGYASGERGFLVKTVDGGKHWKILPTTGTLNWLYGMAFKDEHNGFAVGLNETLIKTTDGGKSWVELHAPADKKFYGFRSIYRDISFNGNTGCIVGQNGSVLVSHDGGDTWEPSATYFQNDLRELMDLRSVQFVTPQKGYAVGELGTMIMMTEDGGRNWTYRSTGNTEWLRAIWAEPSGKLIVVGEKEKVLESRDNGFSWKVLNGTDTKIDVLVLMAHGDDAAINLNSFLAYYAINKGKKIVNVGVVSNLHSSEYEETYDLEMDRNAWMIGVGTSTNFSQFEAGNNGANYYHYNQRLWEGEENIDRHMVAAIRAYQPDIVITHDGVFGDYDKSEHKISGRAGLRAFESAGGETDQWPELTRLGLKPWQPKKLYALAGDKHPPQSYPATIDLTWIANEPLNGANMTCREYGSYVIRNFQSQGVYQHTGETKLSLIRSLIPVKEKESSVFDGLDR
ncbi:MAG: hypothetical protein JWP81_3997 [Ferruginibacter sp.]|nr:hypothetical protein [Ferruginibacter sp.]